MLAVSPAHAQREDQGLQLGCANDYFRLCAGVDPNSQDAERCMDRNRARLSPECRAAIGDYDRRTGGKSQKRKGAATSTTAMSTGSRRGHRRRGQSAETEI